MAESCTSERDTLASEERRRREFVEEEEVVRWLVDRRAERSLLGAWDMVGEMSSKKRSKRKIA